jgi:thiol-disulfide isomerase/thioredoxin
MKHTVSTIVVVLCLAVATLAQSPTPGDVSSPNSQEQTTLTSLPEKVLNAEIQLLGNRTMKLSDFSGKVVVLTLFATWCGPCRFESPALAQLYKEFNDRDLVVIELSTEDPTASKEAVRKWVREFRLPYKVGWAPPEIARTLMQGRESIPQAFVIAPDGRIVKHFIGYRTQMLDQMRVTVEELLK